MSPVSRRQPAKAAGRRRHSPRPKVGPRVAGSPFRPPEPAPPATREPPAPHAHAVCRSCGRIADVPLIDEERGLLSALAERRPDGWVVEGITFSLTGTCARCRTGPSR